MFARRSPALGRIKTTPKSKSKSAVKSKGATTTTTTSSSSRSATVGQTTTALRNEVKTLNKEVQSLKKIVEKNAQRGGRGPKVKRKPNAYNMFVSKVVGQLKAKNPNISNTQAISLAAKEWKAQKAKTAAAGGGMGTTTATGRKRLNF